MNLQVGHVGINVTNLDRSIAFYTELLDLETIRLNDEPGRRFAFLKRGDLFLTLWEQSQGEFSANIPGLHHLAFQLEDASQLSEIESKLRDKAVTLVHDGIVAHETGANSGGLFFLDPDGIRLEIYAAQGGHNHEAPGEGATCGFF